MAGFIEKNNAEKAYKTFCEMLDDQGWKYNRDDEKLAIECGASGGDLNIELIVNFNADKQLVTILSPLPFKVDDDDRVLAAVAISATNYNIVDGNLDFSLTSGSIIFRLTTSIRDSLISKEAYEYMLMVSCATIDRYNDRLLNLVKHTISIEDYVNFAKE